MLSLVVVVVAVVVAVVVVVAVAVNVVSGFIAVFVAVAVFVCVRCSGSANICEITCFVLPQVLCMSICQVP